MTTPSLIDSTKDRTSGAFGVGLVLVLLPGAALVFGVHWLGAEPVLGLPILAIFGIMILFGALALISTLFARLNLDDKTEALALPPGSVRAAIALSLIVLFALISVMLYQTLAQTYKIEDLSAEEKASLVKEPANQVVAVIPRLCPSARSATAALAGVAASVAAAASIASEASGTARTSGQGCEPGKFVYTVHLRQAPTTESTDLAKQLLILIGTLMTSVVSFYFAAKSAEASTKAALAAVVASTSPAAKDAAQSAPGGAVAAATAAAEDRVDGCDAPIEHATPDEDLPAARGGVAT